jgi:hypothetical protein
MMAGAAMTATGREDGWWKLRGDGPFTLELFNPPQRLDPQHGRDASNLDLAHSLNPWH